MSTLWKIKCDPVQLMVLGFEYILQHGGLLHIWGHSWELEQRRLWGALEDELKYIANAQAVYVTNVAGVGACHGSSSRSANIKYR